MRTQMSNDEIVKIVEEAKRKGKKKQLTKISDKKNLSTEDKFKISLCAYFVQYLVENRLKPTELHKQTGIEKTRLSEILHYKINNFTIDKLFNYLESLATLSPKVREHLHFLVAAINLPIRTVKESRELTKGLESIQKRRGSGHRSYALV